MAKATRPRRRPASALLVDFHLYLGLVSAPYFLVYAFSSGSLAAMVPATPGERSWTVTLAEELPAGTPRQRARAALDAVDLAGWIPAWRIDESGGQLRFHAARPGRRFAVEVEGNEARIEEQELGLPDVLKSLHGSKGHPGAPLSRVWGAYTELSLAAFLVALVTSPVLAWRSRRTRLGASVAFGAVAILAVATLAFLW